MRTLIAPPLRKELRVTPGPQRDWFSEEFFGATYRVTEEANRMGLRLDGPPVAALSDREMITEGVCLGAIQVPQGGQPIILFVEQQTTGGYPKIANVISADFHCLGQLRPRDEIRFERVDWETARALLREQEKFLASDYGTVTTVNCDLHKWMKGYIWSLETPYAAVTDKDGHFEIKNVPAGAELQIVAWHEGWNIQPDVVFEIPKPYTVPATGTIEYTYFVIPSGFKKDTWVIDGEVRR
jgi:hypothetical protein